MTDPARAPAPSHDPDHPAAVIPSYARVHLTHAITQRIAEEAGVRLLHLKGPAVLPGLRPADHESADVDVLVHPDDIAAMEAALRRHGWSQQSSVERGSAFAHAANWWHPHWGLVDLHHRWPGPTVDEETTFAALAEGNEQLSIAHVRCPVPARTAQILVLLLHAARSATDRDLELLWHGQNEEQRKAVVELTRRLGAEVALAAALGDLESHRDDPAYALWRYFREGGGRLDEWRARWRAATSPRERRRVLRDAVRLNRDHLRLTLGREPTPAELRRAHLDRLRTLGRELAGAVRGKLGSAVEGWRSAWSGRRR